jgi:hypothetical protein
MKYILAIILLLSTASALNAQTSIPEPSSISLLCHSAEDMQNIGVLLEEHVDPPQILDAIEGEILLGRCIFTPNPIDFEYKEQVSSPLLDKAEIWKVVPTDISNNGNVWYILRHAING